MRYRSTFSRLPTSAILDLKGNPEDVAAFAAAMPIALPDAPNTRTSGAGAEIYWVGREHWLLRANIELEDELIERSRTHRLPPDLLIEVVSDTFVFRSVSGPDAGEVMAVATSLDFDGLPELGVTFTQAFGLKALLVKRHAAFELAVETSCADFVDDCLARVAQPGSVSLGVAD